MHASLAQILIEVSDVAPHTLRACLTVSATCLHFDIERGPNLHPRWPHMRCARLENQRFLSNKQQKFGNRLEWDVRQRYKRARLLCGKEWAFLAILPWIVMPITVWHWSQNCISKTTKADKGGFRQASAGCLSMNSNPCMLTVVWYEMIWFALRHWLEGKRVKKRRYRWRKKGKGLKWGICQMTCENLDICTLTRSLRQPSSHEQFPKQHGTRLCKLRLSVSIRCILHVTETILNPRVMLWVLRFEGHRASLCPWNLFNKAHNQKRFDCWVLPVWADATATETAEMW